ncbi:MAG: hypothetical protein ACKO11_08370 [Cuspidothrix sp.]
MYLVNMFGHEFVLGVSFIACILGLLLLWDNNKQIDEAQATEESLLRMSFAYWLVYCISFGIDKVFLFNWEVVIVTLKITTALSYFLTFSCILSLPLHKFAVHEIRE